MLLILHLLLSTALPLQYNKWFGLLPRFCLSIIYNIIIIITITDEFRGKEPCQNYWHALCVIKIEFYSIGPPGSLFLAVDMCIKLNEMACSSTQFGLIFSLLVVLFMFKERRWAFWHFNNVMLPISCPWPRWKMPTPSELPNVRESCHPPPTPSQNNAHYIQPSHNPVLLLFIPPFCSPQGIIVGGLLTNSWCCLMRKCCQQVGTKLTSKTESLKFCTLQWLQQLFPLLCLLLNSMPLRHWKWRGMCALIHVHVHVH